MSRGYIYRKERNPKAEHVGGREPWRCAEGCWARAVGEVDGKKEEGDLVG